MALPTITYQDFGNTSGSLYIKLDEDKRPVLDAVSVEVRDRTIKSLLSDAAFVDISLSDKDKWNDLLDGVTWIDEDGETRIHEGLTLQIKRFIYQDYTGQFIDTNPVGFTRHKSENSTLATGDQVASFGFKRFNEAVAQVNENIYPFIEFYEEVEGVIDSFIDNLDNTYQINTSDTKYLSNGDIVVIKGVEYLVSSLIADTSFIIDGGQTGLTFEGTYLYEPYKDLNTPKLLAALW